MRSRGMAAFWALLLIGLGVLFLLQTTGALQIDWSLMWPALLILLGGALLVATFLGPRRVSTGSQVIPMDTGRGSPSIPMDGERGVTGNQSIPLNGVRAARLEVHHGAGRLRIHASPDPAVLVRNTFDGDLTHRVRRDGDRVDVQLRLERDWFFWIWPWNWGADSGWDMAVNRDVALALDVRTGASRAELDLRDLKARDMRLETGASTVDIWLPAVDGQLTGHIQAGASTIRVRVPERMAVRVRGSIGAAALTVRGQHMGWGTTSHQSPDYETNPNRVDLEVEAGAATIDII